MVQVPLLRCRRKLHRRDVTPQEIDDDAKGVYLSVMTIELTNEQEQFIQQEIASGAYANEAALLTDAVELLRKRKAWIADVQAGVKQGREDIAAGRYMEVNSPEDAQKLKDEVIRRGKERLAQREHPAH